MLLSLSGVIATLFFSAFVFAAELSTLNSSVRALGMGDAFTALADDESSLFYNPAGLARVRGLNLKIFGLGATLSGVSAYEKVQDMNTQSGSGFADAVGDLYGEKIFVGAGGEATFTMPMLGFGVYDHAGASVRVDNPVYPALKARVLNDYGYVMGFGAPLAPVLHAGLALKYIKRTGADKTFGPGALADLQPDVITSRLTPWGVGYGLDLGVTAIVPAPFFSAALSAAWKNVGGIKFRSDNLDDIPSEPNNMTLGVGLDFDLPLMRIRPAIDVTYLNDANLQLMRKINMGVEIDLPIIDVRAGFHEGYYTVGVGLDMGLFRVDAATYGVELGDYPGQLEDRRYVAQFTMELGLGDFSVTGDSKKGGSGSKAGTKSNSSVWGGKRLKQRR